MADMMESTDSMDELILQVMHGSISCVLIELFKEVSIDYKIPYSELCEKYIARFRTDSKCTSALNVKVTSQQPKPKQVSLNDLDPTKCIARTQAGNQCQRKNNTGLFCKGHSISQPSGRMDQPPPQTPSKKPPAKSGASSSGASDALGASLTKKNLEALEARKAKEVIPKTRIDTYIQSIKQNPPEDDDEEEVTVESIIFKGVTYLRDIDTNCVYNESLDAHVGNYDTKTSTIKLL